jgi:arylsulfatase A-like enzyme
VRDRPNILWIYSDELRADALGCYGHPHLPLYTPHLDALAGRGVRFANNFCNSPVCVSSRVITLTGRHPERTGVYGNEGAWHMFELPVPLTTFPEVFADNSYATASFGKTHLARDMSPPFQHNNGEGGSMNIWSHLGEEAVSMIRSPGGGMNGGVFPSGEPYPPEKVTRNGLAWLAEADGPWLARFSYLQPHTPVLPPQAFVDLYSDCDWQPQIRIPEGVSRYQKRIAEIHGLHRMTYEDFRNTVIHYYAQVAWLDSQVGAIMAWLAENNAIDNTLIVFGADHGNPLGDVGHYEKHTYAPSVHRMPFIIAAPDEPQPGRVDDNICDSLDLSSTLFGYAGIQAPESFLGRDLLNEAPREAIFSVEGYGRHDSRMGPNGGRGNWDGTRGWPQRSCVRTDQYRLDVNTRLDDALDCLEADKDLFLCDWRADPEEIANLANAPEHAEAQQHLLALLAAHREGAIDVPDVCLTRNPNSPLKD